MEAANILQQEISASGNGLPAWVSIRTLNNRLLLVRPDHIQRIFFIDDGSDWPPGERSWETTLDDYAGFDADTYQSMAMWADNDWSEWKVSEPCRINAVELIENGGFSERPDDLRSLLRDTVIHFADGTRASYRVSRPLLVELVDAVEANENGFVKVCSDDEDFERFENLQGVRAIEIPLIELEAAYDDIDT